MSTPPTTGSAGALVRLAGPDALPLLHRIATAYLADLAPGQVRATLFCDFRARLLHRAAVAVTADGAVWLLRDDGPGEELRAFVDRSVFRENLTLADAGIGHVVRARRGTPALPPGTLREANGLPREVQVDDAFAVVVDDAPGVVSDPIDELDRIVRGQPRHRHEIAEDFTPFEVGLAHEVHLSKGCFTGQETLMRLVTYRGPRRRLVGLAGSGAAPDVPGDLLRAGERCGRLTSACADGDDWRGLAVVALEAAELETVLATETGASARVVWQAPERRPLGLPAP